MKTNIIGALGIAFIYGTTGTCLANANPFADVPTSDWSYGAISNLVDKGLVRRYSEGSFDKTKVLTRNEMAVLVAEALSKEGQADAEAKGIIDQLAAIYARELSIIGVENEKIAPMNTVDSSMLNKGTESKLNRITFEGSGRVRFDGGNTGGKTASRPNSRGSYTPNSHINVDLNYAYKINNDWSLKGESEYGRQMNYGGENQTLQNSVFEQLYLTGPLYGTTIKVGRYSAYSPLGLVYDDKITGGQVKYVKGDFVATFDAGKATSTDDNVSSVDINGRTYQYHSQNYQSLNIKMPVSKLTNLQAGYYRIGGNMNQGQMPEQYVNYYTLAMSSKLADNLMIDLAYAKSNMDHTHSAVDVASTSNCAYLVKLTYRNADITKPGSFDIFAMYRKSPMLASYSNTDDWVKNVKGIRIGADYIVTKNMGITTWYTFGKDIDTEETNNMYRIQWNFRECIINCVSKTSAV